MKLIQLISSLVLGAVVVEGVKVDKLRELNAKFNVDIQPQARQVEEQVQFRSDELNQKNVFYDYQTPVDLLTLPITPKPASDGVHKICSLELLNYGFANSYGKPYLGKYKVPKKCIGDGSIVQTVLKMQGDVKGRQFDRFGTLFLNNTELLRFTTAEPTNLGITWKLDKDVSDYNDLFTSDGDVYLDLGNLVNEVYTGTIYVQVQVDLYVVSNSYQSRLSNPKSVAFNNKTNGYATLTNDTIYNQYFSVKDGAKFSKLELDLFYSNHGDDEFYYFNKDYTQGKSSYREIQIYLDDKHVASVWPFISIYTGGITLSLWRPVSGLGSFNLPSEKIDLSMYLPLLTKRTHKLGLKVVNANAFWLMSTNLLLKEPKINNNEYNQIQSLQVDDSNLLNKPKLDSSVNNKTDNGDGNFITKFNKNHTFITLTYNLRQPRLITLHKFEQKVQFQQGINITQQESVNDYDLLRTFTNKLTKSVYKLNFNFDPIYHKNFQFEDKFLQSTQVLIATTNQMQFKGKYSEVTYPNNGYKLESDLYLDLKIKSLLPNNSTTVKDTEYQLEYYKYWGDGTAIRKDLTAKAVGNNLSESQQSIKTGEKCFKRYLQAKDGYFIFDRQVKNCEEVSFPEIQL